ncbi:SMI1/KNR4 family protein [Kitasatospora sp. NPDC058190]|uniref:SMI1/KNR4 family protein n=1 Tax=Kitasatospora sp. NPDC058190 TaxID=3346371 RepID=UPI0036DA209A
MPPSNADRRARRSRPDTQFPGAHLLSQLVGSPGWIVIGDTGGGDRVVVDLTPGPRGHLGQIIVLDHEQSAGAHLLAESLTDLVLNPDPDRSFCSGRHSDRMPVVARLHGGDPGDVEAAAHPDLEVLTLGGWSGEPASLPTRAAVN